MCLIRSELILVLVSLDGMLVHRRVTPCITLAGTHSYTWVQRAYTTPVFCNLKMLAFVNFKIRRHTDNSGMKS